MTFIKDLEPCNYFPLSNESLVSIGWLDSKVDFNKGEVTTEFFKKLIELCRSPWQPVISLGLHQCELCQFEGPLFKDNVFIPYQGKIYVAPVGIVHYIASHWYRPPDIFIQAVLECPNMNSMEYKKKLLANGGRCLLDNNK